MTAPALPKRGWYPDPRGGKDKVWWTGKRWMLDLTYARYKREHRKEFYTGLLIGFGAVGGVMAAHAINGAAAAPAGWELAKWANANGVQL